MLSSPFTIPQHTKQLSKQSTSSHTHTPADMSLKPKIVEFVDVWPRLRCIAESVITLSKVERAVWNTSFR